MFRILIHLYNDLKYEGAIFELDINSVFMEYLCQENSSNFEEILEEKSESFLHDNKEIIS